MVDIIILTLTQKLVVVHVGYGLRGVRQSRVFSRHGFGPANIGPAIIGPAIMTIWHHSY